MRNQLPYKYCTYVILDVCQLISPVCAMPCRRLYYYFVFIMISFGEASHLGEILAKDLILVHIPPTVHLII